MKEYGILLLQMPETELVEESWLEAQWAHLSSCNSEGGRGGDEGRVCTVYIKNLTFFLLFTGTGLIAAC